jgi:hypothetical protein
MSGFAAHYLNILVGRYKDIPSFSAARADSTSNSPMTAEGIAEEKPANAGEFPLRVDLRSASLRPKNEQ